MSRPVDVLATLTKAIDGVNMLLSPEHALWNMELREARAAVADLIKALRNSSCFCEEADEGEDAITCDRCHALSRVGRPAWADACEDCQRDPCVCWVGGAE